MASKSRVTDLFGLVREFATRSHGGEVFQMLSIFHLALQSGSFLACAAGFHRKGFLEEAAALDADVLRLYATFLAEKVSFHNAHRFVEGNMSLGTFAMIWQLNQLRTGLAYSDQHLISAEFLQAGLGLLERALALEGRLLELRDNASMALFLIPVVKETFSLAVLLGHLLRTHAAPAAVVEGYARALATQRIHYELVNSVAVLTQAMGAAPDLALAAAGSFPPSHSPFVTAYLEKQRQSFAASAAAVPQFEANFDAHFPAPNAAPAAVAAAPPLAQPQAQLPAPRFEAPAFPETFAPPPAVVPSATPSPVPNKVKEERLRRGEPRGGPSVHLLTLAQWAAGVAACRTFRKCARRRPRTCRTWRYRAAWTT